MQFDPTEHPHRRRNPLTGQWVLVSPHRTKRPWLGQVERSLTEALPKYDASCYLCPGNERAGGHNNPSYTGTFVFENDYAALLPVGPTDDASQRDLFQIQAETGICRVICFSPRHDLTLPEMSVEEIGLVVDVWSEQVIELGNRPEIGYVQLFENKGAVMGASSPHPHGQVWANKRMPQEPTLEDAYQCAYFERERSPLLADYLESEIKAEERLVLSNEHWVVLVPYWAIWPYETLLLPRRVVSSMPDLDNEQRLALADIMKRLLTRYDNLFETSFPYSMGWHGQPTDGQSRPYWVLHAHFYPPLLRSATVKKFMVGYEMLANPQRDITAEQAAVRLRSLSEVHYRAGLPD